MIDEWAGTAWAGAEVPTLELGQSPPRGAATVVAKASIGAEGIWNGVNVPLSVLARSPLKVMREQQALYWNHPWVGGAEDTVTNKVAGLPWHLEDQDKATVDDEERDPRLQAVRRLLEKPQANLPDNERQTGYETWKDMTKITSRHAGVCGVSYWYLDAMDAQGIPNAILYVNPARLFPVMGPTGQLLYYILDPKDDQGRGGTRMERREIIPFYLKPPDWGALPQGLVARAMLKARVNTLTDQHSAYQLGTGGRIPGVFSPKDGKITDDEEYEALVQSLRNVNEAPDAAKRTTVLRGPIDFTATGVDPVHLELNALARLTRDDIYSIWGIQPSQGGIPSAGGLNSGEMRRYDYEQLMSGPVHDRVDMIGQTVQLRLLDRWESSGSTPQLVIEEPDFDDQSAPYELAAKAREQPITANERRALLNLDPLPDYGPDGEPLGLAILLPTLISAWAQGPEPDAPKGNPFGKAPKPEPVVRVLPPPPGVPQLPAPVPTEQAKAREVRGLNLRGTLEKRVIPAMQRAVESVLAAQMRSVASKFRARGEAIRKKPSLASGLWDEPTENARLAKALNPHYAAIAESVTVRATEVLGQRAKADPFTEQVEQYLTTSGGKRVVGINETTRDAIVDAIRAGVEADETIDEIAGRLEGLSSFDDARAELVARTESGYAYNEAAVASYREYGVGQVEVIDGDQDEACASANGSTWTLEEALGDPLGHPNCTRDFAPVAA